MASVRKTRRVGQWSGHPQERLVGSHLPNKSRRQKAKKRTLADSEGRRGGQREKRRKKCENGRNVVVYPGISTTGGRAKSPSRVIVRLDLERGCSPRQTHEAENIRNNTRHLRNVYHSLRERPIIESPTKLRDETRKKQDEHRTPMKRRK